MNIPEFEKTGILKWHSLGYKGSGINIVNFENCKNMPWFDGKVFSPKGWSDSTTHGTQTMDVIHQVAPLATKYSYNNSVTQSGGKVVKETFSECLKFMIQNDVSVVTASLGGNDYAELIPIYEQMGSGSVMLTSAGNKGMNEPDKGDFNDTGIWIPVGAYHLVNGKNVVAHYTSSGEEVVCAGYSNLNVHTHSLPWDGNYFRVTGTSFSSPLVAGQVALVQEFFKKHCDCTLSNAQMREFIKDHCDGSTWDSRVGYGLFVLPHPNEINVSKYLTEAQMAKVIEMWINKRDVIVDGVKTTTDVPPAIVDGRAMVPIRFVSETMGMNVVYDHQTKKITISQK